MKYILTALSALVACSAFAGFPPISSTGQNYLTILPGQKIQANAVDLSGTNVTATLPRTKGGTGLAVAGASGNVLTSNGTDWVSQTPAGGGGGTVTSVNVSIPNYTSGGAVTTSGTVAMSANSQAVNKVYAGPSSGGAGVPTFRDLATQDIPFAQTALGTVILSDTRASGTASGTGTASAWTVRTLQTIVNPLNSPWVSLSSNQFTLAAGTYLIEGHADFWASGETSTRLRNVTDSVTTVAGTGEHISTAGASTSQTSGKSTLSHVFTIATSKTFQVEYFITNASTAVTLGWTTGNGENEVFSYYKIEKLQ